MTDSTYKDIFELKTFLELDKTGSPATKSLRVCVAALLWEMAHIDSSFDESEFSRIIKEMDRQYHFMDEEAGEIVQIADFLRRENKDINDYISEINDSYDDEQREHVFQMVWRIASSDGHLHPSEERFAEFLRKKLNLGRIR